MVVLYKLFGSGKKKAEGERAAIFLSPEDSKKAMTDIPKSRLITVASVAEKYKCNFSLARKLIKKLAAEGQIKPVILSHRGSIYTSAVPAKQ